MKNEQKIPDQRLDLDYILDSASLFQSQPCLYYLINANEEVIYIGQTRSLYSQLMNHRLAGRNFARFSYFPCEEGDDLDALEQEAIAQFKPILNKPSVTYSTSGYLSKHLICLKHNITPVAFEHLRKTFGLQSVYSFGNTKYYKPEDVEAWLKRFRGLVARGRHVLQAGSDYLAVGISTRTKQIQLYKER
ncbi:hypothetical protein [Spirosoma sp.]|uniref:hypothetical protein n=1 Tax=Spirosoma sp. TaxID=1899569 RepID=UPI003B3B7045